MRSAVGRIVAASVIAMGASGVAPATVLAQPVSVTSAEPSSGEQDTPSLTVRVRGKNFAPGATVDFLLDNDTNGGVTVIGQPTFLSSSELEANVNIAAGATLALFDIRVRNTNGRTGRGSDLFQVIEKGARAGCANEPLDPSKFALVTRLNSAAAGYGPHLGVSVSLAPATLLLTPEPSTRTVLIAAVGTPYDTGRMEFFVLDAGSGALLDGTSLCTGCTPQAHVSVVIPSAVGGQAGSRHISKGDVNADGLPDFAVADQVRGTAAVFVGSVTDDGRVQYTPKLLSKPANATNYGYDIAMGDLDGLSGDEVAVAKPASGNGKNAVPAKVFIYKVGTAATVPVHQTFQPAASVALKSDDGYALDLAIGDVTNDGRPDLIVGAPMREVAGVTDAGAIFVHRGMDASTTVPTPYQLSTTPWVLSAAVKANNESLGQRVAVGDADSSGVLDIVALTAQTPNPHGELFHGFVMDGLTSDSSYNLLPRTDLTNGWGQNQAEIGDINGDHLSDVVIAVPSAAANGCTNQGMVYVYFGQESPGWARFTIQGEQDSDVSTFGFGMGIADGYPFIVVGNNQYSLANESLPAGQVYVYKVLN